MKQETIKEILSRTTVDDMLPICIPSYHRPDFILAKNILSRFTKKALEKVFVFVRAEEYKQYNRQNPWLQFIEIPKGTVTGLGDTRNYIFEWAAERRLSKIMDMDDDIFRMHYMYTNTINGNSKPSTVEDLDQDSRIPQKCLQLTGVLAKEAFKKYPNLVLGGLRKRRFCQHPHIANTKYFVNKGSTPRQTKILNVKRLYKAGIRIPQAFNIHGEDIGYAAHVVASGYDCFIIQSVCFDPVDCFKDSVVRDPKKENRELHKMEEDALIKLNLMQFVRTAYAFPDGQYQFGDINWGQVNKIRGTKPIVEEW